MRDPTSLHAARTAAGSDPASQTQAAASPCSACTRRQFLSGSVLTAVTALLTTGCGDGVIGAGQTSTGPVDLTVNLADYPALATVGAIVRLQGTSTPIAVVHASSSSYVALSLVCPHQGSTVGISGSGFLCPNHGARFNASGGWVGGQTTGNLTSIPTVLDAAAGTLRVSGTG